MLLARSSLPPQFLLPAWSSHQIEQALRRIHTSTSPAEEDTKRTQIPAKELESKLRIRRRRTQKGYLHRDLENQTFSKHTYLGNPEASPSSQVSTSRASQDETQQARSFVEDAHEQKLSAHQRWVKNKASRLFEEKDVAKRLEVLHATVSSPKRRRVIRQHIKKLERIETVEAEPEPQRVQAPNNAPEVPQGNAPRAVPDASQHELTSAQRWTRDTTLELLEERDDSKRLELLQAVKRNNRNSILVLLGKLERGTEAIESPNPRPGNILESQLWMRDQAKLLLKQYTEAKKIQNLQKREAYNPGLKESGSNTTWTQSITKSVNWFLGRSEVKHEFQKAESRLPEGEAPQMRHKMESSEKQNKAVTVPQKQQSPKAERAEDTELSSSEIDGSLSIKRAVVENHKANREAGEMNSAQSLGQELKSTVGVKAASSGSDTSNLNTQNLHSSENQMGKLREAPGVVRDEEEVETSLDTTGRRIQRWVLRNPQDETVVRNSFTSQVSVWRPEKPYVEKISDMEATKRFFEWQSQQGETISDSPPSHRHKAIPQASKAASNAASQTGPAIQPQAEQSLSLFEELFPEERKARSKKERTNEERLFNLPAFNWTPPDEIGLSPDQMVKAGKRAWKALSRGEVPKRVEISELDSNQTVDYTPFFKEDPKIEYAPNMSKEFEPSVLILHACSKNLEESDFFRLGPKGNHIEGWTSGIKKGNCTSHLIPCHMSHVTNETSDSWPGQPKSSPDEPLLHSLQYLRLCFSLFITSYSSPQTCKIIQIHLLPLLPCLVTTSRSTTRLRRREFY